MNIYLYLILNLGSLSIPLLYSIFEKKFHFIQYFKAACFSILIVAVPFLIWDALFTKMGIWGFNPDYHLSYLVFNMPFEEWLFFFCIPYACLFTYEVIRFYFPNFKLSKAATILVGLQLLILTGTLLIFNFGKWYTTVNFMFFIILTLYGLKYHLETLRSYVPVFAIILVPFFLVNGVLTGSFIESPVVWYDDSENLGFRLFTIPFEDVFYAFNMLFSVQLIFNFFKRKYHA
ncbi:lycopene cyclase domain-containing protein [Tamlana sp. 2_MG-2023]|uniref:lycopene cyclase domain-containing protein n=1 Tax=unclassified Tamlana TaxID=2614803 RepID=UPI0026E1ACB7|nr:MULTISPECIES: lycopene cyclase domain-containing protein [unclassified Tamlana]MDO6759211.1 lycopene cyclase domain-containing protein [Tamlana sp. 2_MG-2023]MDO6790650.1 lycopene cyclase domain-containing protein [Tamlana sp. 1_MG-2023]